MSFGTWDGAGDPCRLLLSDWGRGRFPSLPSREARLEQKKGSRFLFVEYENQLHNSAASGAADFPE